MYIHCSCRHLMIPETKSLAFMFYFPALQRDPASSILLTSQYLLPIEFCKFDDFNVAVNCETTLLVDEFELKGPMKQGFFVYIYSSGYSVGDYISEMKVVGYSLINFSELSSYKMNEGWFHIYEYSEVGAQPVLSSSLRSMQFFL